MKNSRKFLSIILSVFMLIPIVSIFSFAAQPDTNECEHEYKITNIAPTCVDSGYKLYVCTKCGYSYKDFSDAHPALGHNFGEWEQIDEATCTTEGHMKRVCSRCGASELKTIPVKGHIDENFDGKCDRCGSSVPLKPVFSPFEWFKALWHAIIDWFVSIFA